VPVVKFVRSLPGREAAPSIIAFAGIGFGAAAALLTTVIIGRAAGPFAVGSYFQFVAIFSVLVTVCTFGADTGLVRFLSASRALGRTSEFRPLLARAILPVVGVALLVVTLGVGLVHVLPLGSDSVLQDYALASAPFLLLAVCMTAMFGALRGLGKVVQFTLLQSVLLPLLRILGVVVVVHAGLSIDGLVTAWLLPVLVTSVTALVALRIALRRAAPRSSSNTALGEVIPPSAAGDRPDGPAFWRFSSARGVSSILEIILEWLDVLVVAVLLGPSAAGIYAVVTRCIRLGQIVDHAVRTVSSPAISAGLATGETDRVRAIFVVSGKLLVLLAWPVYLTLLIKAPDVLSVFGAEFAAGATAMRVIAVAMLIAVTAGGVQSMLLMGGRSHWQAMNKGVALAVAAVLLLLLVPHLGIVGAAMAWSAAILVDCFLATYQVARRMQIRLPVRQLVLPLVIVLIAYALPLGVGTVFLDGGLASLLVQVLGSGLLVLVSVFLMRRRLELRIPSRPDNLDRMLPVG
jgi:O-antigen/teichoic acid export membrane protein